MPATNSSGGGWPQMDRGLLKAASCGDSRSMLAMASHDPSILLGSTPLGNTCLHISSIHGHQGFCDDVLQLNESFLSIVNLDEETPLIIAVAFGHVSLAYFFLWRCCQLELRETILQQDRDGCNALHHAIRSGHKGLAVSLIEAEPGLSQGVSIYNVSPMFIALMKGYVQDVLRLLLDIPDSAHEGHNGRNVLHVAVRNGDHGLTGLLMDQRPWLAKEADGDGVTPVRLSVNLNKIDVLRLMLETDPSLGHDLGTGLPLLFSAAHRGHVGAAGELLNHCPDVPYRCADGLRRTCLHVAVLEGQTEFVQFILTTPRLRRVINMQDDLGKTALHYAVQKCNPELVRVLLSHESIDTTVTDNTCAPAVWGLWTCMPLAKTLNWNEVCMLMSKADCRDDATIYNLREIAKQNATKKSRKNAKSLTKTYTSNTSLVAILMTTITFAAAFTLPGGYSSAIGSEGLPIMSRKLAFWVFLISDSLAMCTSFAVAFICSIAWWEDYEFLVYYISFTKKLMWFAYIATTIAFATGLYTVLASRLQWLAIGICALVALLPILTKLLGEWPTLKLKIRSGKSVLSALLDSFLCFREKDILDIV